MRAAQQALRDALEAGFPAKVVDLEERLGYGPGGLELPRLYAVRQRVQLDGDAWPAVIVDGRDAALVSLEQTDTGATVYRWRYTLRVLLFVRGDTPLADGTGTRDDVENVAGRRDDYVLAARELLLDDLTPAAPAYLEVNPLTLTESYSDVLPDDLGRSIAAGYVDVQAMMDEEATRRPLGTADLITVNPALLDD